MVTRLFVCSGVFPEAEVDPVIQIASMVQRQGEKEPFIRTVFTLQSCASIVGSQILCFTQEKQLLQVLCVCVYTIKLSLSRAHTHTPPLGLSLLWPDITMVTPLILSLSLQLSAIALELS